MLAEALVVPAVQAQTTAEVPATSDNPAKQSAPQASASTDELDAGVIIVTANRVAENIQNVPVAVTAVSDQQLRTNNLIDTKDLQRIVPTLGYAEAVGARSSSFYVRGVGTFSTAESFDSSVGTAVNGIPAGRNSTAFTDMVDVERVEVLEGPQGLLFGRNASAGLINVVYNKPRFNLQSFDGRVGFGNFKELQLTGAYNFSNSDKMALRATGWHFAHNGYINAPFQGRDLGKRDSFGGRLALRLAPSDKLDILLTVGATTADNDPFVTTTRAFVSTRFGVQAVELGLGLMPGPNNRTNNGVAEVFYKTRNQNYAAVVDYSLGDVTLTSSTGFERFTLDDAHDSSATPGPYQVLQTEQQTIKQFTQELRLANDPGSRLRIVAGLFYFDLRDSVASTAAFVAQFPSTQTQLAAQDVRSKSYAVFGQATFDLLPQLRVLAGGRYSHDNVYANVRRTVPPGQPIIAGLSSPGAQLGAINFESRIKDTEPSWRFGLQYDVYRDVMTYATVSHGYKAAGLDLGGSVTTAQIAVNGARVLPETVTNYEVGVRSQLFDRRVTLNLTAFHEVFRNFQVSTVITGPPLTTLTQNAKRLTSSGVTAQATARLGEHLSIASNVAYVDAKFKEFPNATCYAGQPVGPAGSGPGFCVGGSQDLAGKPLPNSPKWTVQFSGDFHAPVSAELEVFANANYQYRSRVNFDLGQDPLAFQGGYDLVNLSAGVRSEDGSWSLRAYLDNAFNTNFVSRIIPGNPAVRNITTYQSERRFGLTLDVKL
ncbi:MAG TPA: TonB-dependent receptor [Novosphingobium sp.]|nr:TonB-dependent receptor [Novosphingobium sp.]